MEARVKTPQPNNVRQPTMRSEMALCLVMKALIDFLELLMERLKVACPMMGMRSPDIEKMLALHWSSSMNGIPQEEMVAKSTIFTQELESGKMEMAVPLSKLALILGVGPSTEAPPMAAMTPVGCAGELEGWGSMALMVGTLERGI